MIRRRPTQVFSLAFLDCICCGFGAIILIFVLSIGAQDQDKLKTIESLKRILAAQISELARLNSTRDSLEKDNSMVAGEIANIKLTNDSVHSLIDDLEAKIQLEKRGKQALLVDIDELQKLVAARQKKPEVILKDVKPAPVGIPVGSNYLAFVIDTSGSMREPGSGRLWDMVIRKVEEVLKAYPEVRGIQVLNSDGNFIVPGFRNAWLPDTPDMRDRIKRALRSYDVYGNSNPVPGIFNVFRYLDNPKDPDMHVGIYVFGDDFNAGEADPVLKRMDELNPADADGHRRVVINAIGFPTAWNGNSMGQEGLKFSNLMRELTYRHGGAMILLQDL